VSAASLSNPKLALSSQVHSTDCLLAQNWQEQAPSGLFLAGSVTGCGAAANDLTYRYVLEGTGSEYGARLKESRQPGQIPLSDAPSEASGDSGLRLEDCRSFPPASSFTVLVQETAFRLGVQHRALAVRALLHLPRVATRAGWITRRQLRRELRLNAERLRRDERTARSHVPLGKFQLDDLIFQEIDSALALPVLASLHYLRSVRPGSRYFALVDPINGFPVSLCSMSPLEWKCVGSHLKTHFAISPERVWDVSRVYSLDIAPPNAISLLLSRVRRYLHQNMLPVDLLVTAVDPNLGFTGSSYRASNWQQWMTVQARPYLYEKGRYVSPRQLREHFGTSNLTKLQANFPGIFQQSRVRLLDSMIFAFRVSRETEVVSAREMRRLHR
jgi:hypothetical protein